MTRFADLKIRTKLVIVFLSVLLPLLASEVLTIWYFNQALRHTAEQELTNVVRHFYRSCEINRSRHGEILHDGQRGPKDFDFLKQVLLSFRVGVTGYPFVMDTRGNLIIHPLREGQNIYDMRDTSGVFFTREICLQAQRLGPAQIGTFRYPWQNVEEGETEPRLKLVKFVYFQDWDWVIVAGTYEEEIYMPLKPVERYTAVLIVFSLGLALSLILALDRLITGPVKEISEAAARLAGGNLDQKVAVRAGGDELGVLARSFNSMADQIRQNTEDLELLVRQRTRELGESREKYRRLVQSTVDGICTADLRGTITFANAGMGNMIGLAPDRIIGGKIWEFYGGGMDQARSIMNRLRVEGNITNYETELVGPHGPIPILTSASMLRDENGRESGSLGIFTDITQRKQLEAELRNAQVHLAQTMKLRALGDLVAGVAHEITNPLMASKTMLHVIEKSVGTGDQKLVGQIEVLKKCNQRIAKIVDHLRNFSRQSSLELKEIDLNQPLENALLLTEQQLLAIEVSLERDLGSGLPPILGDANHLEQVFLDLIANARDALEAVQGKRTLRVSSRVARLDGKLAVAASITDSGPGIPEEIKDKIFEPFFTTKEVGKGTGLGLPICDGLVAQHGGRIVFDSQPGKGTTFTILIPAVEAKAEQTPEPAAQAAC